MPINQIKIGKRQRKALGDIEALARSIADIGLLHPIVIRPDGTLVSGKRRLVACQSLGWTEVPVRVVHGLEDTLRALKAENDENICRKNFLPSEAVAMGEAIEDVERKEARDRLKEGGRLGGKGGGKLPQASTGKTRDRVGAAVGLSGKTYERAKEVVAASAEAPEKFAKLKKAMDRTGRVNGVYKQLQTARTAEAIRREPPSLPGGRFRVVLADPPWPFPRADDPSHKSANPYPPMSVDAIKALDVGGLAHDDAVVWLWTPFAHLRQAFEVLDAWGFTPKTMVTWVKDHFGTGVYLRSQSEYCLMAVRGHPTITLSNQSTVIHGPLRKHSEKPESFYELVESLCPGNKLELFARRRRAGWTSHGHDLK
jgi:N6-adenosine-specific RNA methylase IME4